MVMGLRQRVRLIAPAAPPQMLGHAAEAAIDNRLHLRLGQALDGQPADPLDMAAYLVLVLTAIMVSISGAIRVPIIPEDPGGQASLAGSRGAAAPATSRAPGEQNRLVTPFLRTRWRSQLDHAVGQALEAPRP
jgi:hypothetical protein